MNHDNVGGVLEKIARQSNSTEQTFYAMYRLVMREMRPHLSSRDFEVLFFIFDRTYAYHKTHECIPYEHFLKGVWVGEQCLHPPVACGRTQLKAALKNLNDNGIITSVYDRPSHRTYYSINAMWVYSAKKRNNAKARNTRGAWSENRPCHSRKTDHAIAGNPTFDIEQENSNLRLEQCGLPSAPALQEESDMNPAKAALLDAIAGTTAKNHDARTKRKAKGGALAYMKMWEDAHNEFFPEDRFIPWLIREQAAFKKAIERVVISSEIEDFVRFSVGRWQDVIASKFGWMRQAPTQPVVSFVTKNVVTFYAAFIDDRDPNRDIKRKIKTSGRREPSPHNSGSEEQKLRDQLERVTIENERLKNVAQTKVEGKALARKAGAKRLVLKRKISDPELGKWRGDE